MRYWGLTPLLLMLLLLGCDASQSVPPYTPTFEDYQAAANPRMGGPALRDNQSYKDLAIESYRETAALYVALECLEGRKLSAEAFRKFADLPPGHIVEPNRRVQIGKETIRRLLARIESGSTSETCMRPYMYPESATELGPAIDLIAATFMPTVNQYARPWLRHTIDDRSYNWFQPGVAQGKPFLVWFCAQGSDSCFGR